MDAREETEFQNHGRISGATHLNQLGGDLALSAFDGESPDRPILIYCALGGRSEWLASDLQARGFKNLAILEGGLHAWKDAGLPVEP